MKRTITLGLAALLAASLSPGQTTKKVVITSRGPYYSKIGPAELADFRAAAPSINLVVAEAREQMMAEIVDADGIIGPVTPEMIRVAKKLRWVQVQSAAIDQYLSPEMVNSPIVLTNCKITQGPEIADHAFGMLLAFTRELYRIIPRRTEEKWLRTEYHPAELLGKTAVIVGVGGIGTNIAVRAKAFGMHVIGLDPREVPPNLIVDRWYPPDRLDQVLPEADVVFVAAPATPLTLKMFSARQFSLMKKTAYFIAVSRGRLYDMDALVKALETRQIAGAGVDVTDPTEPLPPGHPLWKFENVIITPHIAGRSDGEHARYMALFKENLRRFANGEPLIYAVDKQKGY